MSRLLLPNAPKGESAAIPAEVPEHLVRWVAAHFPPYRHMYWRLSGTAMLLEALGQSERRTVILPAFMCPTLSTMAVRAGKRVVHIDVDRDTLLMNADHLERCLGESGDADSVLLVDHCFGYACAAIKELRRRHSDLLIIEDCVRALGSTINGEPVGRTGDWVLLSLYKTIPGSDHGAVLLTRSPCEIRSGPVPPARLRERLATFGPARWFYEKVRQFRPSDAGGRRELETLPWAPHYGAPNGLALKRFAREVGRLEENVARRRQAAREIQEALADFPGLHWIRSGPDCETSGYFLSFTVAGEGQRNRLVAALHRRGFFLLYAWATVPAFIRCFQGTFPFGSSESTYLADHICHVPVVRFLGRRRRTRLIRCLRQALQSRC